MKYKRVSAILVATAIGCPSFGVSAEETAVLSCFSGYVSAGPSGIELVSQVKTPCIYVDDDDFAGVVRAAEDLKEDIAAVTGVTPTYAAEPESADIIIGTIGHSDAVDMLAENGELETDNIAGEWEAFTLQDIDGQLVIAGADKRGTIYGIYDFSENMGVSPWVWWADVAPQHSDTLYVSLPDGGYTEGASSVKYRGIFINQEWNLYNWSTTHSDTGEGMDTRTYEKIFELLLRLKANYMWPAMHEFSPAFNSNPENARLADEYGIVMGSSHCEMLLRNNMGELLEFQERWIAQHPDKNLYMFRDGSLGADVAYDYTDTDKEGNHVYNKEFIEDYWRERVRANKDYESNFTIGMRGVHDGEWNPVNADTDEEKIALLEEIISVQRRILEEEIGRPADEIPQTFIPYKEILPLYNAGLDIPDDVTVMWTNDNYGHLRQTPNDEERKRSGGSGVYYHVSYYGRPSSLIWNGGTQLGLIKEEMTKAYDTGAQTVWMLNVGSLKLFENQMEYFLDLGRDVDSVRNMSVSDYVSDNAKRYFGFDDVKADEYAAIQCEFLETVNARRPDFMKQGLFELSAHGDEGQRLLKKYSELERRSTALYNSLADYQKAGFYELQLYAVRSANSVAGTFINADRSLLYSDQGRGSSVNKYAELSKKSWERVSADVKEYNSMLDGKWENAVDPFQKVESGSWDIMRKWTAEESTAQTAEVEALPYTELGIMAEGQTEATAEMEFSGYSRKVRFIDIFNKGTGSLDWKASADADWIVFNKSDGTVYDEDRIYAGIDWDKAPAGESTASIYITWYIGDNAVQTENISVKLHNDTKQLPEKTYAEADGYVSIEAEHYTSSVSNTAENISDGVVTGPKPKLITDKDSGAGVLAVYHEDMTLASVQFTDRYENGAYVFDKPAIPAEGESVKGMVWTSAEEMKPLSGVYGEADESAVVLEWVEQDDLGRSGTSMKLMPDTAEPVSDNSVYLEYDVNFESTGTFSADVYRMPTLNERGSVNFGIGIDEDAPTVLEGRNTYYNNSNGTDRWGLGILNNTEILSAKITVDEPGIHKIRLYGIDPCAVVDKIVITTGEKQESYYGAPESFNTTYNSAAEIMPEPDEVSEQMGETIALFEPKLYTVSADISGQRVTGARIVKLEDLQDAQITAAVYDNDGVMVASATVSGDFENVPVNGEITVPIDLDIPENAAELQIIAYDNEDTLNALSPVYSSSIEGISLMALYSDGVIELAAELSSYMGMEAICLITDADDGSMVYIRQETVDSETFRKINTGKLDGVYDVRIGVSGKGIAASEKAYTEENITADDPETSKTLYSWDFSDESQTAAEGMDKPVVSGNAAYDAENEAVKLISQDNSGSGNLAVTFDKAVVAMQGESIIITSKVAYGRQSGKYTDWSIIDSNGNVLASTHICLYSSSGTQSLTIGGKELLGSGLPGGIATGNKNNSGIDNGYTVYTTVINPDRNTITLTAENAEGSSTFTGEFPEGTSYDVKSIEFSANAQYASRSSYVDDISVTRTKAPSYNISFEVTDDNGGNIDGAMVTVTDSKYSHVIEPEAGGIYKLCAGMYTYKASAQGYEEKEGVLELSQATPSKTISIALEKDSEIQPTEEPTETPDKYESTAGYWYFDFGTDESEKGFAVSADTSYTDSLDYGFIGNKVEDYRLSAGEHIDGFRMLEGQVIELENGNVNETSFVTASEPQEPVRFAMSVENGCRYKVKVKLANASGTEPARVTLMTERRHQLITDEEIEAGGTLEYEFSVDVETYYWKALNGKYVDDTLSVQVIGKNAAISSLEVTKAEDVATLWVITDSTGCDQPTNFPYANINSLAGVGQGLTKYLPADIAISNQGDGGLNSSDTNHYSCAKSGFKAGDYLYVEYGHNETSVESYTKNLQKYYSDCQAAGVKMIVAGPIDRCQTKQFDTTSGKWSPSGLTAYAAAGREFVEEKQQSGADDIAFVDLNEPWIGFLNETTERVRSIRGSEEYEANSVYYYYRYKPSGIDTTHINEAGADNAANIFFNEAKRIVDSGEPGAEVLSGLVSGMREWTPYTVSDEIIAAGPVPNSYYPETPSEVYEGYEAVIRGAEFDGNTLKSVTAKIEHYTGIDAKNIPYAVAAAEMYDDDGELSGIYYSGVSSKYDATNGNGVFDLVFDSGAEMPEGGSYRIYIQGFSSDNTVMEGEDYRISEYFTPDTASNMNMIGSAEDISVPDSFDYYGVRSGADLGGNNGWYLVGSSTRSATLERNGETYAQLTKSSESGSYVVYRAFDSQVSGGRLIIDADLYCENGTMRFILSNKTSSPNSGYDTRQDCFTIENGMILDSALNKLGSIAADEWTHINYVLDMDYGVQTLTVGDDMYEYAADGFDALVPENVTVSALQQLNISGVSNDTLSARITGVSVRSEANSELPYMTLTLTEPLVDEGSVAITNSEELSVKRVMNGIVEIAATPVDGYIFAGWFDENGSLISGSPSARIRMHRDVELTAVFEPDNDPIEYVYKETFTSLSTQTLAENGWISKNAQSSLTVKNDTETWQDGSYVYFDPGTSTRNAKVIFPETARLTESYVLEMDFALVNGSGSASEFAIFTNSTEVPDNSSVSGDYILKLVSTSSSKTMPWIINDDAENTVTLEQETRTPVWAHMKLTVDPQSGAAELVITQNGEEKYNGQIVMNVTDGDYSAAGMNFKAVKSYSRCQFDNIRIYSAAQEIQ